MGLDQDTRILYDLMVEKSQDSFILALEIINRPTIKFRTETFLFNICNSWELILKAHIIQTLGVDKIFLPNQSNRTISMIKCANLVFTDYNNPIKINLTIVNRLRNTATHLILPEYDEIYVGLYQANILFYVNFFEDNFNIDFNAVLPKNFLTIATNLPNLSDKKLTRRVSKEVFDQFRKEVKAAKKIGPSSSVSFEVSLKQVKKNEDLKFKVDSKANETVQIINKWLDYSNTHVYRQKHIIEIINKEFGEKTLNQYTFRAIRYVDKIEENEEFYYFHSASNTKTYSEKCLNMIRKNIREKSNYIIGCVDEYKKSNPRS